jgi:hypothetical protein
MATARIEAPEPVYPPKKVVLELDEWEADTLRALCSMVAGDPANSPRRHAASIADALDDATDGGSFTGNAEGLMRASSTYHGIWFDDYPEGQGSE